MSAFSVSDDSGSPDEFLQPPLYRDMTSFHVRSPSDSGVFSAEGSPDDPQPELGTPSSRPSRLNSAYSPPRAVRNPKNRPLQLPLATSPTVTPFATGADAVSGKSGHGHRRVDHALLPLFEAERVSRKREPRGPNNRRPSLSCVSLSGADIASQTQSPTCVPALLARRRASCTAGVAGPSAMAAPTRLTPSSASSVATTAVFERTSFVTRAPPTTDLSSAVQGRGFPVSVHVYDLSTGLLDRYSKHILGRYVPGMYHSAIVCYGMEFYFEGGIGVAGSGQTRFGGKYKSLSLGYTAKPLSVFLEWIDCKEVTTHQVHDYHLTRHNCHHFCDEAGAFLLEREHPVPRYVFTTVDALLTTELGAAVHEVLEMTTKGTQQAAVRLLLLHALERQASMDMILHGVTACGVLVMPPIATVLFRVEEATLCRRCFDDAEPYVRSLIRNGMAKPAAMGMYRDFAKQLCAGADTLAGHNVLSLADLFADMLLHNPLALWGPPLNALRIAVLHRSVAVAVVFHARLMRLLLLGSRDLPRMLPDGRLAMLRLLCNFGATPHGAAALQDSRYCAFFVAVVGQGLIDDNGAVAYTAACLANNIALSSVILSTPSLKRCLASIRERHPLLSLLTIALYNVNYRGSQELPEPCFNMLLLTILRIVSTCTIALENAVEHPFRLRYTDLLRRSETNESRALLCIIKTIEDLYRW